MFASAVTLARSCRAESQRRATLENARKRLAQDRLTLEHELYRQLGEAEEASELGPGSPLRSRAGDALEY